MEQLYMTTSHLFLSMLKVVVNCIQKNKNQGPGHNVLVCIADIPENEAL